MRYGAMLHCTSTVHVYTCFTSKHVFLACTDNTRTKLTMLHVHSTCMSALACCTLQENITRLVLNLNLFHRIFWKNYGMPHGAIAGRMLSHD